MIVSLLVRVPVGVTEPRDPAPHLIAVRALAAIIEIGLNNCAGIMPWHSRVELDEASGIITIGERRD